MGVQHSFEKMKPQFFFHKKTFLVTTGNYKCEALPECGLQVVSNTLLSKISSCKTIFGGFA